MKPRRFRPSFLHAPDRSLTLEARYVLDQTLLHSTTRTIAVVDDLITTGAHFVAVRNKIREAFPTTKIVGLFIARRVPEAVDLSDFDES